MKFVIAFCTFVVLSIINSSEAACSNKSWKAMDNMDGSRVLGRWYAVRRYANGKGDNSDCLWHDLRVHPTIPNAIEEVAFRSFKNGKGHKQRKVVGTMILSDPNKPDGIIHLKYNKAGDVFKYVTAADYDDFGILRACFGDDEYFWAYSRNQFPSNETLTNIYREIDAQGIDRSKIIESCHVPASELS